jgi:outer membrane protein TolC
MPDYTGLEKAAREVEEARVEYDAAAANLAAAKEVFKDKERRLKEASKKWKGETELLEPRTHGWNDKEPG